jgi:hypothetical protein
MNESLKRSHRLSYIAIRRIMFAQWGGPAAPGLRPFS